MMLLSVTNKKKKPSETEKTIPDTYTLIAADLSLKRPGFCKMKLSKAENILQIDQISLMSVDNKTKTKARGRILAEIKTALSDFIKEDGSVFFVRERSVNNCGGKIARSGTAARTGVSEVVGITDLIAWEQFNQEWDEIFPVSIKKLITGNGKAEKQEVATTLAKYVGSLDYKNDDESDATAVAIAWLINHKQIIQEDTQHESDESTL